MAVACKIRGNQLYIKHQEGDENFEPVEAYFFDPTEYLEEDGVLVFLPEPKRSRTSQVEFEIACAKRMVLFQGSFCKTALVKRPSVAAAQKA